MRNKETKEAMLHAQAMLHADFCITKEFINCNFTQKQKFYLYVIFHNRAKCPVCDFFKYVYLDVINNIKLNK